MQNEGLRQLNAWNIPSTPFERVEEKEIPQVWRELLLPNIHQISDPRIELLPEITIGQRPILPRSSPNFTISQLLLNPSSKLEKRRLRSGLVLTLPQQEIIQEILSPQQLEEGQFTQQFSVAKKTIKPIITSFQFEKAVQPRSEPPINELPIDELSESSDDVPPPLPDVPDILLPVKEGIPPLSQADIDMQYFAMNYYLNEVQEDYRRQKGIEWGDKKDEIIARIKSSVDQTDIRPDYKNIIMDYIDSFEAKSTEHPYEVLERIRNEIETFKPSLPWNQDIKLSEKKSVAKDKPKVQQGQVGLLQNLLKAKKRPKEFKVLFNAIREVQPQFDKEKWSNDADQKIAVDNIEKQIDDSDLSWQQKTRLKKYIDSIFVPNKKTTIKQVLEMFINDLTADDTLPWLRVSKEEAKEEVEQDVEPELINYSSQDVTDIKKILKTISEKAVKNDRSIDYIIEKLKDSSIKKEQLDPLIKDLKRNIGKRTIKQFLNTYIVQAQLAKGQKRISSKDILKHLSTKKKSSSKQTQQLKVDIMKILRS